MTNRTARRSERRSGPKARPAAPRARRTGLRILVVVAVAALIILALASTQFMVQPVATPSPTI
jgi:hypothetical protein